MNEHALPLLLAQVTELAALAAARCTGSGDRVQADRVATEAMRRRLNELPISGVVTIGEGERDEAPMLYIGEELGSGGPELDIAVDPLEGTNLCATGAPDAITMMALSERGGLCRAPDVYMDVLVAGPECRDALSLQAPVAETIATVADRLQRDPTDVVVALLDRPRHAALLQEIRATGARVKLISDGTLVQALAAMMRGTDVHVLMGSSGAPEAVLKAACARLLGGYMEGRFRAYKDEYAPRLEEAGLDEVRVYSAVELAPGSSLLFAATGVTSGSVLHGVRFFGGGARTHTVVLSNLSAERIRYIDTVHVLEEQELAEGFRM